MEIRFGIKEDGSVAIEFGASPKASRPNKGKSLLTALTNFVSLDIETTGLSPLFDDIIELSAVKYRDGVAVDSFSSLVKPESPVDEFVTQLTGITNEMLADAPVLFSVLPIFIDFVGEDIVVGHNVNFDVNFIYDACESLGLPAFSNNFVDTMRLARRMYKDLPNHKLDTLISHFGLDNRTLHRALDDCKLTAVCFLRMMADTEAFEAAIKFVHRKHTHSLKELVAAEGFEDPDSPLYRKVCVFTGTLENFSRKEAAQLVINIGGTVDDRVTKKTNFLILGNNDYCTSIKDGKSNKQKQAEKLIADGADLSIIPESVFLDILYDSNSSSEEPEDDLDTVKQNADIMEQEAFDSVAPALKEILTADNLSADYLFFKQSKTDNAQYSSVYLFNENNLFCRISFRGKQTYFSVASKYEELIPAEVEYKIQKSDSNYCRIAITSPADLANHIELLKRILNAMIDAYPADFGCCSRYESCSDAKKCINPNPDMALRCIYRKNMKKGKIFYGKNKNT